MLSKCQKPKYSTPCRRTLRLARALFAHAFMSDTKWRKMIVAVRDGNDNIDRMTVKFIDVSEPRYMRFPPSLQCPRPYMDTIEFGPVTLRSIEWVELNGDLTHLVQQAWQVRVRGSR